MLSGFIEYHKPPVYSTPNYNERYWSKKYCDLLISNKQEQGFKPGAECITKYGKVKIDHYSEVPEEGYRWSVVEPCLIQCKTQYNTTVAYRFDELTLVDTTTGEIKC